MITEEKTPELIDAEKQVAYFIAGKIEAFKIQYETKALTALSAIQFVEQRINESIEAQKKNRAEIEIKHPNSQRLIFCEGAIDAFEYCLKIIKTEFKR